MFFLLQMIFSDRARSYYHLHTLSLYGLLNMTKENCAILYSVWYYATNKNYVGVDTFFLNHTVNVHARFYLVSIYHT